MPDFSFTELLPIDHSHPDPPWRMVTADGISTVVGAGRRFLQVDPEVLTILTRAAFDFFRDVSAPVRLGSR